MTVTSSDSQAQSHRLWAILVTLLAVATTGYFVWEFLFASIRLPTQYASVEVLLSAECPPIVDDSFFAFEQETYKRIQKNREITTDDLLRVGNLSYAHGDPTRASFYFRTALSRARVENSDRHVVLAMNSLGVSETARGEVTEGQRLILDAYDLARNFMGNQTRTERLHDQILLNLGWHYLQVGEFSEAWEKYKEAEEIFAKAEEEFSVGQAWSGQGRASAGQHDYQQAIALHQQALVVFGRIKNYRAQAGEIYYLAEAELAAGNYEDARKTFAESVHIYLERAYDWVGALKGKAGIGRAVEASGQLYPAMLYATEVMEEYRDRGHRLGDALSRIEIARLAERREKVDQAIDHYTKAAQRLDEYEFVCRRQEISNALTRLKTGEQADNEH